MAKFAANTEVSVEASKAEIERTIHRYGATSFMAGYNGLRAIVAFEMSGKRIRFDLTLPDPAGDEFCRYRVNQHSTELVERTPAKARELWEQACRQRWRALLLLIKAKMEAIEGQITSFDEEMLSHIVMPDGRTVAETVVPGLAGVFESGKPLPPLLGPARK